MQRHAEMVCKHYNETMGKELKASQVAFIAMTPDGAVKAMVGGRNYADSQYNRVTQAFRQPGSSFKTFVYTAAMESGLTPETMMDDSPYNNGKYHPSNYKHIAQGEVSLRTAFVKSVNSISVRLTEKVTPTRVIDVAHRLGITRPIPNMLSIALGAGETTLLELTAAHATFANKGHAVWPYGVIEVRDKEGNIMYQHTEPTRQRIIAATPLSYMRDLLKTTVQLGSGRAANIDSSVAGKTGSNGDKDAFFLGYRDEYEQNEQGYANIAFGAWVGNDSGADMAKASTGGRIPTRICADFLKGPNIALSNGKKEVAGPNTDVVENSVGTENNPQKSDRKTQAKNNNASNAKSISKKKQPQTLDDLFE
jgi:penicillin-binding protein 1A